MDDETRATRSPESPSARARIARSIYSLAHRIDTASLRVLDAGAVTLAWIAAYAAGFEGHLAGGIPGGPVLYIGLPLATQLIVNQIAGLYGPVWRYASVEEGARVVAAVAAGTLISTVEIGVLSMFTDTALPILTTPAIAAMLMLLGCGGIRFQARLFAIERAHVREHDRVRTVIVGAGSAGVALAHELTMDPRSDTELLGFVDDDPALLRRSVRRLPVLGTTGDLEEICRRRGIERTLIALPQASRRERQAVVDRALRTNTQVKVLPGATELMDGALVRNLRDIDLTDLLGREHAPVDASEIAFYLKGATVLVTGAGGSIGSEIAKQVVQYGPSQVLMLDRDESLLHEAAVAELADAELILANIRDDARMREVFGRFRPDVVFHAAAHKHVPILEKNPVEAVQTNLLGAARLARLAADSGCTRFIHVSTDKAALPVSVMGATKRAAELVVFAIGNEKHLPFAAVRFGNVLGSRGSVVPTFLRQIVDGGPVTVTDPEMTRYFMTIPEAVSLVLQAGAIADGGKTFLLDMGSPVTILEMANQMIRMAGLRPGEDIEVRITGSRPGERLHEQLHDDAELLEATSHPSISGVVSAMNPDRETLFFFLDLLEQACNEADGLHAVELLEQLLRQVGIECCLDEARGAGLPPLDIQAGSQPTETSASRNATRPRNTKALAILDGKPAFESGLAFARPVRPPIEKVVARLEPSYTHGMLTNGPLVSELEERAAARLGVDHVVAVSSCTSGLVLALQALVDGRDGAVALPSFTFSATGHAVLWNARTPKFVDCDPTTFQIDIHTDHAAEALDGAAALMATHVFGAPCTPEDVSAVASERGIPVLFDAAHAFGTLSCGRPVGCFGAAEVFSLTPTKVLVAGEGGLVATRDEDLAATLRIARDYGNPGDYDTLFAGLNARMSEFHAAMALESLTILDDALARRRSIALLYRDRLRDLPGIGFQQVRHGDASTYKDFTITVATEGFGLSRDQLAAVLRADGIDSRSYFSPPVHRQHAYRDHATDQLPNTDYLASTVLSLPIYPDLGDEAVNLVAETIRRAHERSDAVRSILREVPSSTI